MKVCILYLITDITARPFAILQSKTKASPRSELASPKSELHSSKEGWALKIISKWVDKNL
jgi:hypothetical protein